MKIKLFALAIAAWGCLHTVALRAQNANCSNGTVTDAESYTGTVFFNFGSVTNAYTVKNRMTASVGEQFLGSYFNQQYNGLAGFYSRFLLPPLAPNVIATQGELLDRIQLSWSPEPLGAFPSEGFNIYRDGIFLATVGVNIRSYNDFNVIAGRAYNYEVRGISVYGEGVPGRAVGFQVPNGTVTGWIQTPSGRPVPDALVALTPLQGFSARFGPNDGAFAMSNKGAADTLIPLNDTEWTLAFWIKTAGATDSAGILSLYPFPLMIRAIASATGHEGIEIAQTDGSAALLTAQFPDSTKNGWHHVAFTMDKDNNGRLYLDGRLIEIANSAILSVPAADELRLGAFTGAAGSWEGRLDELRVYHRRLDELDLGEAIMGTASSQTAGLKYYWKMDEELGAASFDVFRRNKLYFCGAAFDADRPFVRTMGKTNQNGYYRIESASYGTGTTFIAEPMKDFYLYRALKFTRSEADYAQLPDFSLTPKATLELVVNSAGPDGVQCLISRTWPNNNFQLKLAPNGNTSDIIFSINGQDRNFGTLGVGYQHLAFTIDSVSDQVTAYKNGVLLGNHTFTGLTGNWSDPNTAWVLGARASGGGYADHYGGLIDEFAVYDTILGVDSILSHAYKPRNAQENGLRVYFALDEGNGNRLNNSGSVLLPFGTNFGADWSPLTIRQTTTPHVFTPDTRQVTLNPSVTSVDQVDFVDRSTIPVSGFVRYKNTDCFAKNVEILVNGASYNPKIITDSTGKFTIDFDPGATAVLTPVFEDHVFVPAFWEVTNVVNPIAGILFNDVTTRKVSGKVAGGLCKKSVIEAPPGQGQGTVCVVKVRSTDGCFERQLIIDNQEGDYEFDELPPLESMTVAVTEHSNPDIKSAFQVLGGATVNLTRMDTVVEFIYFAPPEVIINSGFDPYPGCAGNVIVLDRGDPVNLSVSLVERYVATPSDDGVCPLDTAAFRIINGIADRTLDTTMSNGVLTYRFRVGEPNPSPPFLKTLQITGTSLAGRSGTLVVQVVVTGIRNKENTFTTLLPETPSVILRDPPGDGSYAYLEKGSTICNTYSFAETNVEAGGSGIEIHLGGNVEISNAVVPTAVYIINNAGWIADADYQFIVSSEVVDEHSLETCLTTTERFATTDRDDIVGGENGGDIYLGTAFNLIFGFADLVSFDETNCQPVLTTVLNVNPDTFATVFMYSEYHIVNNTMRYLDSLIGNPNATAEDLARYTLSKQRWQQFIDLNAGLKEKARLVRNISFDAGVSYEFSETADTTAASSKTEADGLDNTVTTHIGYEFNKAGFTFVGNVMISNKKATTNGNGTASGLTVGYVLADDDPGDAFSVDVAMDSAYRTPVFRVKAGQSSCPWEPGTANREAPNLALAQGSQFTAINVPANEPAVFQVNLGNLSATNEDLTYGLTAIANSNPNGAVIKINGQPMNNNIVPYLIPYGTSVPVTVTIERGPVEYEYDSLQIALVSQCEYERDLATVVPLENASKFVSSIYLGVDFIRPCSEVDINVPEQNWVVLNDDPIQPGTLRRITVSGYDLNSTDFQLVRVQYRRTNGDGAWINLPTPDGVFERYNPNWSGYDALPNPKPPTLGPSFTQFFWETAGIGDDEYEIHAWAVCTGDASDKPGFSQIIKGRIDREPASIVGVPQPADGVYQVGDEVSFTFNQQINCDKLIPADLTQPNNVGLYDATTGQLIDISVTCFENKIVIDPTFDNRFYENRILRAELHGIEDLVGNAFNGTKFNKGVWEFYVDRNELAWLTDSVGATKFENEPKTVVASIHNRGGYPVPFKILNAPDWVHITPDQGTLAANEIRPVYFSIDSTLAFGHWTDSIVLRTETGQNPFFMGGDESLPIGARVVCRPPYGSVNAGLYENTMSMVLKVDIEGEFSTDAEDIVAAFINDELRGRANVQYVPLLGTYLAYLTIYGDPADQLDPIRIEVWDASACQRYGSVQESFVFQPDNVVGTPNNPQIVHTNGLLLREVPINFGWNWLSFNLEFPDAGLNPALASLHHPQNDLIRSQGPFSVYSNGWVGSLNTLNNTSMYIYRADQSDTLRMVGTPIDPATLPISLTANWNWIGYVPNYSLPIDYALASMPAQPGDLIKSQTAFAQYSQVIQAPDTFYRWIGNLKYLAPPNGYQVRLTLPGTLTYPPAPDPVRSNTVQDRGGPETPPAAAYWSVNPALYEHSSTLIGMIRSNGSNVTTSNMELGAFAGAELRGAAQAIYIQPLDAHLFFLTMYANTAGELLRFKLYDDADGSVRDLPETMYFSPNQHQGELAAPVPFELQTTSAGEAPATAIAFEASPNPFSSETALRFVLPSAQELTLTITDARGREVVRRPVSAAAGANTFIWNGRSDTGGWMNSGVYLVRLQTERGSVSKRVVIQRVP